MMTQNIRSISLPIDSLPTQARDQLSSSKYADCARTAERALEMARELRLHLKEGEAANILGSALLRTGMTGQALALFQNGLRIDSPLILASALISFGNICERTGQYTRAPVLYTEALSIARETGDLRLESCSVENVGIIHERLGETACSLHFNIRSLELKEKIEDRCGMGVSYNNVTTLYHDLGEYPYALEAWMRSLEITEAIGDREGSRLC